MNEIVYKGTTDTKERENNIYYDKEFDNRYDAYLYYKKLCKRWEKQNA